MRIVPLALVFAAIAAIAPAPALADEPPPTPAQIEAAKKAFAEGKKLHQQGKYAEAIGKFKESYRLSKNPLLLYNIAFTMDEAKEADMALFYYRRFLKEAPAEAEQRAAVTERVKVLEQQFSPDAAKPDAAKPDAAKPDAAKPDAAPPDAAKPDTAPPDAAPPDAAKPDAAKPDAAKPPEGPKQPLVIKPPGTYSAKDFQHQLVELAPPAKPLDITAYVPEDSGFVVTLYFRTAGEGKYSNRVMTWRYKELVGRIPAAKMIGTAVQYYIEVRDTAGALVTRSGKSTSPNLVDLEAGAMPRFYPDLTDDGEAALSETDIRKRDDEDDPLSPGKKPDKDRQRAQDLDDEPQAPAVQGPVEPPPPGDGFRDVGSKKFEYSKWGSTGAAGAMLGLSIVFYMQAGRYGRFLEDDAEQCGRPPCRTYDPYAADLQASGKRYQTLSKVTFGVGLAASAVAGYFWIQEYRAKKRGELRVTAKKAPPPDKAWGMAPVIGGGDGGFLGAAAARRF